MQTQIPPEAGGNGLVQLSVLPEAQRGLCSSFMAPDSRVQMCSTIQSHSFTFSPSLPFSILISLQANCKLSSQHLYLHNGISLEIVAGGKLVRFIIICIFNLWYFRPREFFMGLKMATETLIHNSLSIFRNACS